MEIPTPAVRHALLMVLQAALVSTRFWVGVAINAKKTDELARENLVAIHYMIYNLPSMIEGTYCLDFDEEWFRSAMANCDKLLNTSLLQTFEEALLDAPDSAMS